MTLAREVFAFALFWVAVYCWFVVGSGVEQTIVEWKMR